MTDAIFWIGPAPAFVYGSVTDAMIRSIDLNKACRVAGIYLA
jgi:hypothetical protein